MRIERDFPGHFIGSRDCKWIKTTDVIVDVRRNIGAVRVRISTVGEYFPEGALFDNLRSASGWIEVGYNRLYETMVFKLSTTLCSCGCGAPEVEDWGELDMEGYNTRAAAEAGHEALVTKYLRGTS